MRFYWLEIKKARPLWAYFVGFALLGLVAYGTGYSFIGTNGDIIDPQQVAQSTWISASTQLYCLMLGPIIVSILAAGLAKAEIQGGAVQLYKSRGRFAQRKISALIVVFGVFGAALSITLLAGWFAAIGSHGVIFGNSFPTVGIFAFRNVLAVIAWGLICFAIYAWIRDIGVGFTVCLGIMLVGLGILVSSSKVAQYNPILPFAGAVGYPFPDYSLLSWLPLLIGLGIGFVAVSVSWKHLLARPEKEN